MAKINWTFEAEFWLKDIHDFIAQDNPNAASIGALFALYVHFITRKRKNAHP